MKNLHIEDDSIDFNGVTLPNLEKFTCYQGDIADILVSAKKLQRLVLNGEVSGIAKNSFNQINLSNLKELSIYAKVRDNASWHDTYLPYILNTATQLNKLKFNSPLSALLNDRCYRLLAHLDASGSNLTNAVLQSLLRTATHLTSLDISKCKDLQLGILKQISCPHLEFLNASFSALNAESLTSILQDAKQLKGLNFSGCELNSAVHLLASSMPFLKKIDISQSKNINPLRLFCLPGLQTLKMSYCKNISFTMVNFIPYVVFTSSAGEKKELSILGDTDSPKILPDIEELSVNGSDITLECLCYLLKSASKLKSLDLHSCKLIDGDRLHELPLESLKSIELGLVPMSKKGVEKLKSKYPALSMNNAGLNRDQSFAISRGGLSNGNNSASQQGKFLDANTAPMQHSFDVQKIFYSQGSQSDPAPNNYRLNTFDTFILNPKPCSMQLAFTLNNSLDLTLISVSAICAKLPLYKKPHLVQDARNCLKYFGKQTLSLSDEWQALASLSPSETLSQYYIDPATELEMRYSRRDNLYYVRKKPGTQTAMQSIDIEFLLDVPKAEPAPPKKIEELVQNCLKFEEKSLVLPDKELTGAEYLNALETQKVGACRHRSLVFKSWMQKEFPKVPVRIVNNGCHSFVEFQVPGSLGISSKWVTRNLGGYPAQLNIHEPHVPMVQKSAVPAVPTIASLSSAGQVSAASKTRKRYFNLQPEEIMAAATPLAYNQSMVRSVHSHNPGKVVQKRLMHVSTHADLASLRHQLIKYCHNQEVPIPCFCIDSPDDLTCALSYIERKADNTGVIHPEAGGLLYDFLHATHARPPLLLVDYDKFTPRDIVRTNTLLDKQRLVDSEALPDTMLVLGLFDPNKSGAYQGQDFYSRFDEISQCPNTAITPLSPLKDSVSVSGSTPIRLYGGGDWEACLLGYWSLQENSLKFVEGPLLTALKHKETSFHITGAPLDNEDFQRFWHDALLLRKFEAYGQTIDLPADFKLTQVQTCAFDTMPKMSVQDSPIPPKDSLVLNPGVLSKFFGEYICAKDTQKLTLKPGLLEGYQSKELSIYISEPLLLAQWARFLDACAGRNIMVNFTFAPGVIAPKELPITAPQNPIIAPKVWGADCGDALAYIQSDDIDFTLSTFQNALVVDVSEMDVSDVFGRLNARFDEKASQFSFDETESFLLQEVKKTPPPDTIVLKGEFNDSLRQELSEWLFYRYQQGIEAPKIICLSTQKNRFSFLPNFIQTVSMDDKKQALQTAFPEMLALIEKLPIQKRSLVELNAMLDYLKIHPKANEEDAWKGMSSLTLDPAPLEKNIDDAIHDAENISLAFHQTRLKNVDGALTHKPVAFLAGMTGVGKTTFVLKILKAKYPNLHISEDKLFEWASDRRPGKKIIFIDEANISSRSWSVFEGLWRKPPHIVIDGQLINLTAEHQVVFAGNPMSYGGERQMPALFKRHGNSVVFDPLPAAVLYQELILPIFSGVTIKGNAIDSTAIALPILEINAFLTACSQTEVLITPRELAMMALLTLQYMHNHPEEDAGKVARYYAYQLSHTFVPKEHQEAFRVKFSSWGKFARDYPKQPKKLVLNDTNKAVWAALCDSISLHELRQSHPLWNEVQQSGGLNALVVESSPGMGKSSLVIEALVVHGYKEVRLQGTATVKLASETDSTHLESLDYSGQKVFYKVPANMPLADKERLYHKAFHEGAWLVEDEMNSAAMMERLRNSLLMGKTLDGKSAKNPGFTIVGTQNPTRFAGREKASKALQHRSRSFVMPADYTAYEMDAILKHKGLQAELSEGIVFDYQCCQEEAKQDGALKAPCFRDMIEYAEDVLKGVAAAPKPVVRPLQEDVSIVQSGSESEAFKGLKSTLDVLLQRYLNKRVGQIDDKNITRTALSFFFRNAGVTAAKARYAYALQKNINKAESPEEILALLKCASLENDKLQQSIFHLPFMKSGLDKALQTAAGLCKNFSDNNPPAAKS